MFTRQLLTQVSLGLGFTIAIISPAFSQITPNGAGTVVNPQGNQINITGGTQAGGNLFHSFRNFNVNSSQVANFLSNPQIQNILARVNGGNPSFINGLLQVTGGNSNLFLMNPAGIVFGQGASLNIPASFTATTANQIGFGNNLFNAFGDNNFSALVGNPDSFIFSTNQAGSIVNAGNLSIAQEQGISLIGGNIVNTGNINAGNITLAAVPGTNRVRISQPGHLLSLEIVPPVDAAIAPLDLPRLLTGSNLPGISSNGETVQVAGVNIPSGQGINITSGNLSTGSQGGAINVLGDRVALVNANLNASGINGGGTIRVGGEYQGGGTNPFNSRMTYVDANSFLNADAVNSGNGGRVIIWADDTTRFYGNISGRGITGSGGFVEVSGKVNLAFDGRVELPGANGLMGSLLLDPANITIVAGANGSGADDNQVTADATIFATDLPANMTISAGALGSMAAGTAINIAATGNIAFNTNVNFLGGALSAPIIFTAGTITSGAVSLNTNGRNLVMRADSINAPNLNIDTSDSGVGNSGTLNLMANMGNIRLNNITTGAGVLTGNAGAGGNINISALLGSVDITGSIDSRSVSQGTGNSSRAGDITITAQSINVGNPTDPLTGAISAYSRVGTGNSGNGGNIVVRATSGDITARGMNTTAGASISGTAGNAGDITIDATNNINLLGANIPLINPALVFALDSRSLSLGNGNAGVGGNIRVNQSIGAWGNGTFNANGEINSSSGVLNFAANAMGNSSRGGDIRITAQSVITNNVIRASSDTDIGTSGNGGDINLNATSGSVNLTYGLPSVIYNGTRSGNSTPGNGGNIDIRATQDVIISGSMFNSSVANGSGNAGNGGTINIIAQNNVITSDLANDSLANGTGNSGNGGDIRITAQNNITTNQIYTPSRSVGGNSGNGGSINISSQGNLSTGVIFSASVGLATRNGGSINVSSQGNLSTSIISSNSTSNTTSGNGGSINISSQGNLSTEYISSESTGSGGFGGNITINAGNLFLASRNIFTPFIARDGSTNATISTQGGLGGGVITITHGGSTSVPFVVGNATVNGTATAITSGTGANTINNLIVPVPPEVNNYGTNISIRTTAPAAIPAFLIPLLTNPTPPPTPAAVVVGKPPDPEPQIPVVPVVPDIIAPVTNQGTNAPNPPNIVNPGLGNDRPQQPITPDRPPAIIPNITRPGNLDPTSPGIQPSISSNNSNSSIPILTRISNPYIEGSIRLLDQNFKEEFQIFTGIADEIATLDVSQAQDTLNRITKESRVKPALIYVFFSPANDTNANNRTVNSARSQLFRNPSNTDVLEVVLVPPTGDLVRVRYNGLIRPEVLQIAGEFTRGIARRSVYGSSSKRMYDLIVAPLEEDLKRLKIDNLVFLMDAGLRSIPIAAMQNKENKFIIENYSVGLMPSLTLTDTTYSSLKDSPVMAMGADRFIVDNLKPLPGVPVELKAINQIRGGNILFNENFTLSNLRQNRRPDQRIVHLATHGFFESQDKSNSFIQLWGTERLTLDQIRQAGWGTPPIDLLVLSACQTALGDRDAELGFAGLAVTSGARSALASLWQVSDEGTMGLMAEFYQQLQTTTTKSEALRQAQLAMLRGEVRLEGGSLVTPKGNFALNEELKKLGDRQLTHPYYWSAFTMIGNPW